MLPDVTWPAFNNEHTLSPSGAEPIAARWEAWNDLGFNFAAYQQTYWFWLGAQDNQSLVGKLWEMERQVSWSTALYFRRVARQDRGFGRMPVKPTRQTTLRFVGEHGAPRQFQKANAAAKTVGPGETHWEPPVQVFLTCDGLRPKKESDLSFSKRLSKLRERRKLDKQNKPRMGKPRTR